MTSQGSPRTLTQECIFLYTFQQRRQPSAGFQSEDITCRSHGRQWPVNMCSWLFCDMAPQSDQRAINFSSFVSTHAHNQFQKEQSVKGDHLTNVYVVVMFWGLIIKAYD